MQNTLKVIGIDPSISSTALCVGAFNESLGVFTEPPHYYLIVSKMTRKMQSLDFQRVKYIPYNYSPSTDLKSWEKERAKSLNVYSICSIIRQVLKEESPDRIRMEAVAFAANGTIDQLAGLNYGIRNTVFELFGEQFDLKVIPPTTIKMQSVGNGQATKDSIIETWGLLDRDAWEATQELKQDDLADSYMIAQILS